MNEIKELKKRADELGIKYANNAGVDKITSLIEAKEADALENDSLEVTKPETKEDEVKKKIMTKKEATKLRLITITNMDQADSHKTTEEVNLSNDAFGKICHRIIPLGVEWACEQAGVDYLQNAKFMRKVTKKTPKGNIIEQIPTNKFNVIVKDFTPEIIEKQKKKQAARGE